MLSTLAMLGLLVTTSNSEVIPNISVKLPAPTSLKPLTKVSMIIWAKSKIRPQIVLEKLTNTAPKTKFLRLFLA